VDAGVNAVCARQDALSRKMRGLKRKRQIEEYKSIFDGIKSSKLNLKQEVKLGRRGGARWSLWVTKVCCELLVYGSPPSAIPSSIETLTATLYGEEPKKLPSLNFV